MKELANKIIKNKFCKDCEEHNLTKEYYNDRPCSTIIYNTVTILVDYLRKDNKLQ
mgnify:CR=1 FL=1